MKSFRRFLVSTVQLQSHDGGQLRDKIPNLLPFLHNAWHDTSKRWSFEICDQEMKPVSQLSAIAASILDNVSIDISVVSSPDAIALPCVASSARKHALSTVLPLVLEIQINNRLQCVAEVLFIFGRCNVDVCRCARHLIKDSY
jgi:hypothetical protein